MLDVINLERDVRVALGRAHVREPLPGAALGRTPRATHQIERAPSRRRTRHRTARVVRSVHVLARDVQVYVGDVFFFWKQWIGFVNVKSTKFPSKKKNLLVSVFISVALISMNLDCCGLQVKSHMCRTRLAMQDGQRARKLAASLTFWFRTSTWSVREGGMEMWKKSINQMFK